MNLDYLHTRFEPSFLRLRKKHFCIEDTDPVPVLHLRRMKKSEGVFSCLRNEEQRRAWEKDCFRMYERAQYTVVSVCVDKVDFFRLHPDYARSIYSLLVGNAIERYFYFLRNSGGTGDVMAEATNSKLDGKLKDLYRQFWQEGTDHISGEKIRSVLSTREIKIEPKCNDVAGIQLADMLAATCFSHCKRLYAGGPDFDIYAMSVSDLIENEKFYRSRTGNPHGYGRVWRP